MLDDKVLVLLSFFSKLLELPPLGFLSSFEGGDYDEVPSVDKLELSYFPGIPRNLVGLFGVSVKILAALTTPNPPKHKKYDKILFHLPSPSL